MGLPWNDGAYIIRENMGLGPVIIGEDSLSLKNLIRFCLPHMLMPADIRSGREYDPGIHPSMTQEFLLGLDMINFRRAFSVAQAFSNLKYRFSYHYKSPFKDKTITIAALLLYALITYFL